MAAFSDLLNAVNQARQVGGAENVVLREYEESLIRLLPRVREGLEDARAQQRYRDANKVKVLAKQRERRAADPVKTRLEGQKSMKRWKERNPAGAP